jgi:hypothetical protein
MSWPVFKAGFIPRRALELKRKEDSPEDDSASYWKTKRAKSWQEIVK